MKFECLLSVVMWHLQNLKKLMLRQLVQKYLFRSLYSANEGRNIALIDLCRVALCEMALKLALDCSFETYNPIFILNSLRFISDA